MSLRRGRAHVSEPETDLLLALVALAAGLTGVAAGWLWATVKVAGRVFGGRWPDLPVAGVGRALMAVARKPFAPTEAFPPEVARLLPGAGEVYGTALALAAAPLAVVWGVACWRRVRQHGRDVDAIPEPDARWACGQDLTDLVVRRPESGRLTLGRVEGRLVAGEALQSVCLFGPTQSGKTTGFALPAVLEWDGPAIVCSVKTDLAAVTIAHREGLGEVKVYDPLGLTTWPDSSWSPLGCVRSWGDARRAAHELARVSHASRGLAQSDFWLESSADLMAPLLWAAASAGLTISEVVRWVQTPKTSGSEVIQALRAAGVPEAVAAFQAVTDDDPRTRSNIYTSARQFLAAFADPRVVVSAGTSDITPRWLHSGAGGNTLYLCAPSHDQERLRPLFVALLQEQIRQVYEWQQTTAGGLQRPLLVVLDEAANIAAMPDLDHLASTCAGHGIQLVTVFQDMAQVRARWGDRAQTVVNNHRAVVFLSGLKDDSTLRYAAGLLGEEEVVRESLTTSERSTSTTESTQYRQLASPDALRRIGPDLGLLLYGHLPPTLLNLRPWYREPSLSRLSTSAHGASGS